MKPPLALLILLSGCEKAPAVLATVLLADSKAACDLRRISLPAGKEAAVLSLSAGCGDIARGPEGEVYLASGREVLRLAPGEGALPLFSLEGKVDSILPAREGRRLFLLEHPPDRGDPPEESPERDAPHRLRLWDIALARFRGDVELSPLAYEIREGPGVVLATQLVGRRVELARLDGDGFREGAPEELMAGHPEAGPLNLRASMRSAEVEPDGRWALLVENGVGGDHLAARLWTLDLAARRFAFHPLAARGYFQGGIAFLSSGPGGSPRAALNGLETMVVVRGDPGRGFEIEAAFPLPGVFHDLRLITVRAPGEEPEVREMLLLAGADRRRTMGYLAAADPRGGRAYRLSRLDRPVDLLEVER